MTRLTETASEGDCHGIVVLDGEQDVCGKRAVAIIDGRGTEDEDYWPACAYHANRYGRGKCVPLAELVAAAGAKALEEAAIAYFPPGKPLRSWEVQRWLRDRAANIRTEESA